MHERSEDHNVELQDIFKLIQCKSGGPTTLELSQNIEEIEYDL